MAKVIAVVSQKGGVGKTTTAVNLAASFAQLGREVLLIEVDPQGSVLPSVGCEDVGVRAGLVDVLRDEAVSILDAVVASPVDGVSVVASLRPGRQDELELERIAAAHPHLLREVVEQAQTRFDLILLDGPPTLGPLNWFCLNAADSFLLPVQAEEYSYRTVKRMLAVADEVRARSNPELSCEGLLLTMVDLRTRMSVRVVNQLHENHGDKVLVSMVPRTVTLQEMPVRGKPTVVHAPNSRGGKAYAEVAAEILGNLESESPTAVEVEDDSSSSLSMVARAGEGAVYDDGDLERHGFEPMISRFPSTRSSEGPGRTRPAAEFGVEELLESWREIGDDRQVN